jgi:hypothetical protein
MAEEVTIHCAYNGMYHHTKFDNPALNKEDEVVLGDFFLTFNNSEGNGVHGYFWGTRPRDFMKASRPQEGSMTIFGINRDEVVVSKYTNAYQGPDETVDRKLGTYKFTYWYGGGSIKAAGSCSKSNLRPIPGNQF